ncbi:response regulator [Anabaena lutea]|uniref:histidine kinase n=1 Tax=Anabaena lutea FACHB-196 TaxID=2692881 RepID=A0ABR8FCR4_9NOST|nr:response regulator [Anabaena lutea]MBD2568010.1 response regulator [Anabaena lutea FACHB-196]
MQPEQQQKILGYFIEEAREHLNTIEQGLLKLQDTLNDPEMIKEVFRAAHSIKGGAAMLGLSSIQHTSHRLEDCFKVLKEHPVQVDQKLESLFLGVADTLRSLLDHLSSPFGLSDETANTLMSETEPVFEWLIQHLELLVQPGSSAAPVAEYPTIIQMRPVPIGSASTKFQDQAPVSTPQTQKPLVAENRNDNWSEFQTQVLQSLREMLQLFKQSTTPSSREKLQECCHRLVKLGEKLNLPNWCSLSQSAANAIANPDNSYLTLAKIVITEIKQAQELVLQGKEAQITTSPQLEALELIPELDFLTLNFVDSVDEEPQAVTASTSTLEIHTESLPLEESSTIIFAPTEELTLPAETSDIQVDLSDITISHPFFTYEDETLNSNTLDMGGLEVGIAEINTLAGIFDITSDLDKSWQQEEILNTNIHELGINNGDLEDEDDDDLKELLSLDDPKNNDLRQNVAPITEDLHTIFGKEFFEQEFLEPNNQITNPQTPETNNIVSPLDFLSDDVANEESTVTFNELPQLSVEIAPRDVNINQSEADTLGQIFDDNEFLDIKEVTATELEIIPSTEISTVSNNSFDNFLSATTNIDPLEELIPSDTIDSEVIQSQPESLSLDTLFDELENNNTIQPTDNFAVDDIFATSSTTEVFTAEDDANNFWNYTAEPLQLIPVVEQDVARELEESIFASASGEALGDSQHSFLDDTYLGDFDFSEEEQVGNIIFTSDGEDDFFADFASSLSIDDGELSLPEIQSFSQEPEAVDSIPQFTNQSLETSVDLELDMFGNFEDDSSQDSSVSLEDIAVTHSADISLIDQTEVSEISVDAEAFTEINVPETEIFNLIADLPEATNQEELITNIHSIDYLESQSAASIDTASDFDFSELSWEEDEITADASAEQQIVSETDETHLMFGVENAEEPEGETTAVQSDENEFSSPDEFAFLDALLDDPLECVTNSVSMPDTDFDALAALLGTDNFEVTEMPKVQPALTPRVLAKSNNAGLGLEQVDDDFDQLARLLDEADQTINAQGRGAKSNSTKTQRPNTRRVTREESMKIPVKQLDEMSNLVGELVVNRNTLEQDHERLRQSLDNLLIQVQHLSDVGARMQELYERSLLEASLLTSRSRSKGHSHSSGNSQDRGFSELEMDHFTLFHTLSQETIEFIVRVRESASDIDFVTEETERVARQFRQVTTQLQEGLTRARMVPFAQAVDRLRRGVRDNGIKCGKQVELVAEGADTLIDKMILDHLTDPLTHMLNNAIAHGIETPEVRKAAGKSPVGIITICAFHQGNQTVISVADDGAGINHEIVKHKAIERGVITLEEAQRMSRQEVYELLFVPDFSTADEIDDIKGRGVGMNVVENNINEIRGTVTTDSTLGKGTTFTIRLPLTLSICKALCCVSDKSRIAFPMDGVEDTLDIPVTDIQQDADGQPFIFWRDTALPFRPLKEILAFNRQISRGNVYSATREDDMVSVVVVRSGNTMVALQIDQVLSEQEIVIKQFEGPAPKPSGVAGATVLGDGRIMPIADVLEIIDIFQGKMSKQIGGGSWQRKTTPSLPETPEAKIEPTVLIIDDSITVRELLSLTFTKAGYRVEQARDGQEAWDKLRSGLPCDIVFCDIEMPRCDGLELLSRIQKDSTLNHLPIAMLTSRGADKHRQMAVQLGASGYFTKPYLEEALLEAASRMLKGEKLVTA